jgi:hypothetical protein
MPVGFADWHFFMGVGFCAFDHFRGEGNTQAHMDKTA